MPNPIQTENQQIGTSAWLINNAGTTQLQAYTDKCSYNPGDTVTLYVSTQVGGTQWSGGIYRVGWYQGSGGRLIATIPTQTGVAQGYYDNGAGTLVNMTGVGSISPGPLEAGWAASYTWQIPANATTGVYEALLVDANGWQQAVKWVVKASAPADYLIVYPDTTDAAYNAWGGQSLYTNPLGNVQSIPAGTGIKVSFNRPYVAGGGLGINFLGLCLNPLKWLERQGYNMAYCSILDLHTGAVSLDNYSAVIHLGHSEYWTKEMRDSTELALSHGVGMAFWGANPVYWQCRLENNLAGTVANKTVTVYRVQTSHNNLNLDPVYATDPTRTTTQWRDPALNRPESTLCGIGFIDTTYSPGGVTQYFPWTVDSAAGSNPLLYGTGLVAGKSYGADLVGFECDNTAIGSTPANLQTIGNSSFQNSANVPATQLTTAYTAPSGALVFAAGSHNLTQALDAYRLNFHGTPYEIPEIQRLFANVMTKLLQGKAPAPVPVTPSFMFHS